MIELFETNDLKSQYSKFQTNIAWSHINMVSQTQMPHMQEFGLGVAAGYQPDVRNARDFFRIFDGLGVETANPLFIIAPNYPSIHRSLIPIHF